MAIYRGKNRIGVTLLVDKEDDLNKELTQQETLLNQLEEDVNALSDKDDTALKVLDGTLEEFDNKDWGLTKIRLSQFRGFSKLGKVVLDNKIKEIYEYGFDEAGKDITNPDFELNLKDCRVDGHAFSSSGVTKIKAYDLTGIGSYAFYKIHKCLNVDVSLNPDAEVGQYNFCEMYYVKNIKVNLDGLKTKTLPSYSFYRCGCVRENAENNIFEFDFRKALFTEIGAYAFSGGSNYINQYTRILLPSTLVRMYRAFSYIYKHWIYFASTTVPKLDTSFQNVTDIKMYVPYNVINAYKTATNWVTHADIIFGWAEENTFEQGQVLPKYNAEGYELTWYSDEELTIPVTSVEDASKIYYCTIGTERVDVVGITTSTTDAKITIIDNVTGQQYKNGEYVPVGTQLTISTSPTIDGDVPYAQTLNGVEFPSPYQYTTMNETDISINVAYWNGVELRVNPNFAENNWFVIKDTIQKGKASQYWSVGDVKEIEIDGLTYGIRIADLQQGRYDYADGSRKTNAVFEFVQLYNTSYRMNATNTNAGGWATAELQTTINSTILDKIPMELRSLLEEVVVKSADGGSTNYTGITESNNKLFIPCASEVALTSYGKAEEGTVWDYYIGAGNSKRVKSKVGASAIEWWLRSPYPTYTGTFSDVSLSGIGSSGNARNSNGVCPCFAW